MRYRETSYNYLLNYAVFLYDEDNHPYKEETGVGMPFIEIIEQTQLAVEYHNLRNDPYFIVNIKRYSVLWVAKMK